jgi:hypothetical protein
MYSGDLFSRRRSVVKGMAHPAYFLIRLMTFARNE